MITFPLTPHDHHVDVDEQNERWRQPGAFIVLVDQVEPLEVPVNVCVLLNHLKRVAVGVNIDRSMPR